MILEARQLDGGGGLGHADGGSEVTDAFRRIAAPAQAGDGGHARIVPTAHPTVLDEPEQEALGQHRPGQVEAGELVLVRHRGHRQMLDEPVVERAVVLELERADGVRDAFDGVALAVGEVVRRVDAPGVAGAGMGGMHDAIEDRVAHVDVGRGHVDLGTQHRAAVGEVPGAHAGQQIAILLRGAIAVRAGPAGLGKRAAVLADLFGGEFVDVGEPLIDEVQRPLVELLEVVRGIEQVIAPVGTEPAHVLLDGVDVLLLLLLRVGVVEAQVEATAELPGDAVVQRDGLGMPDMEVAVGLRRKAGHDGLVPAGRDVRGHDVADEVGGSLAGSRAWGSSGSRAYPMVRVGGSGNGIAAAAPMSERVPTTSTCRASPPPASSRCHAAHDPASACSAVRFVGGARSLVRRGRRAAPARSSTTSHGHDAASPRSRCAELRACPSSVRVAPASPSPRADRLGWPR